MKNEDELLQKYNKLKQVYASLREQHKRLKDSHNQLLLSSGKTKKAMHFAVQKENFLRARIIQKFGRSVFSDLMNHVDCPGSFDAKAFDEISKKIETKSSFA
jgi:hypothetical protein